METANTTGTPRWLRWALFISLALNLMVAGVVGGWMLKGDPHRGHNAARLEKIGGPLTRALSQEDRRAIGDELRKTYRDRGDGRAARHALMEALIDDLRSKPFDHEAVAAHMVDQRQFLTDRLSLGQSLLIDRLSTMTDADRAAYADRLEQNLKRRRNQ